MYWSWFATLFFPIFYFVFAFFFLSQSLSPRKQRFTFQILYSVEITNQPTTVSYFFFSLFQHSLANVTSYTWNIFLFFFTFLLWLWNAVYNLWNNQFFCTFCIFSHFTDKKKEKNRIGIKQKQGKPEIHVNCLCMLKNRAKKQRYRSEKKKFENKN